MGIYSDFESLANDLLGEFGSDDAYLIQTTVGGYDPEMGKDIGTSTTETAIKALFMPVKSWRVDGENVLAGDVIVKAGTLGIDTDPTPGDRVKRGEVTYQVINVQNIQPGDTTVLFELHVRAD